MPILTVTSRGQITFRKEVLQHLGIGPGDKIEVELMPDRKAHVRASRRTGSIRDLYGFLEKDTDKKATIDEINEAAARGWSGLVK